MWWKLQNIWFVSGHGCQNRFGDNIRLWFLMVLHKWFCNNQLNWNPSSFPSYSITFQSSVIEYSWGERSSEAGLLFCMQEDLSWTLGDGFNIQFWYASIKRGRQVKVGEKWTLVQNNLVRIKVGFRVYKHAESRSSLYFGLS